MTEIWRGVLGFEDWYEVSDLGRCRAIKRPMRGGNWCFQEPYPRVLRPLWYRKGYYKIQLGNCNGTRKRRRLYLHRMVWEAFNGAVPKGLTVNHLDGTHDNNRLDNLELATNSGQIRHAISLGLLRFRTKTGWRKAHMTMEKARELRRLRVQGWTYKALAERYNIAQSNVRWILIQRTWRETA